MQESRHENTYSSTLQRIYFCCEELSHTRRSKNSYRHRYSFESHLLLLIKIPQCDISLVNLQVFKNKHRLTR